MTWNILSYPLMAAAVVAVAAQASAEQTSKVDAQANVYTNDIKTHPSLGDVRAIDGAKARLVTTADGAWASFETPCKGSDVLGLSDRTQSDVSYGDGPRRGTKSARARTRRTAPASPWPVQQRCG